jgi:hypothetical protein
VKSNVIKEAFATSLKKAGFTKKADGWYRHTADATLVANLQKSNHGERYYVNLAIWLKALGEVSYPKENQCHIRMRASELDRERAKHWEDEVFDLDHREILDTGRTEMIQIFMESVAIPFLLEAGSLPSLRRLYQEGRLKSAMVSARCQPVLEA